jgi:hypothetical protein
VVTGQLSQGEVSGQVSPGVETLRCGQEVRSHRDETRHGV